MAEVCSNALGTLDVKDSNLIHKRWGVGHLHQHGQWLANTTGTTQHSNLHVVLTKKRARREK